MNSITFAVLRFIGKVPVMTKREEISVFKSFRTYEGILSGAVDLTDFKEEIMLKISSLNTEVAKVSWHQATKKVRMKAQL